MPRIFKVWYDQIREVYNQYVLLLRSCVWLDGSSLNEGDVRPCASTFALWVAILIDLSSSPAWAVHWVTSQIVQYEYCLDLLFEDLSDLTTFVRNVSEWGEILTWVRKERSEKRIGLIQPLCFFPMWRTDAAQFRAVHGIITFPAKQTFERPSLEQDAIASYIAGEKNIRQEYDGFGEWCFWEMQEYFTSWFSDWDPSQIPRYLKFSSGSTADPVVGNNLAMKVLDLNCGYITPALGSVIKRDIPMLYEELRLGERISTESEPCWHCSVRFVPKTALKKRTIGMEHAIVNFFQNGLDGSIRYSRSFPRKYLRLDDQSYSRKLALQGSLSGTLVTIDHSAASDSISLEIVRRLTRGCDYRLIQWLEATRSQVAEIKPKDSKELIEVPLKKFAAMGSVVCFTIESLVFLAMALLACKLAGVRPTNVAVYGDDVIVPVEAYEWYIRIADSLGFKLNMQKSFSSGPFREACGIFAFQGKDITIPCASRKQIDLFEFEPRKSLEDRGFDKYVAALQLANELWVCGLGFARYVCLSKLINSGIRFLSGNPTEVPEGAITMKRESLPLWFQSRIPKVPLFAMSDYDGVRSYSYSTAQWLEQPSDLRVVKKVDLPHIVQTYSDGPLPVPVWRHNRIKVVDTVVRGFATDVGYPICAEGWSDEDRLAIWLYKSRFLKRTPLHTFEGFDLPFEEPLTVEFGRVTSFGMKTKAAAI